MTSPNETNILVTATAFRDALAKVVATFLPNVSDQEDVAQETILRLMKSDYASIRNVEAWMTTAAKRLAIDRLRQREERNENLHQEIAIDDTTIADRDRRRLSACLTAHLDQLDEDDHRLLEAADVDGWSRRELAVDLRLTEKGLNSRLRRARQKLRGLFASCCRTEFDKEGNPAEAVPKNNCDCDCD